MISPAFPVLLTRHGGLELLRAMQRYRVDLLVIGGTALAYHGARDCLAVQDLDILVRPSRDCIEGLRQSLSSIGWNTAQTDAWLNPYSRHIPIKSGTYLCDVFSSASVDEFDLLSAEASTFALNELSVPIAGLNAVEAMIHHAATVVGITDKIKDDLKCIQKIKRY